jgi:hypothetical protein
MPVDTWLLNFLTIGLPTVAVAIPTAYALFKWLGAKWIEHRFSAELEKLKHEHNKEIERVRQTVQSTFSRISKIHEKEFEVLPKAWLMLHDTYGTAYNFVCGFKQIPDFGLPEEQVEEFVSTTLLSPFQRTTLLALRSKEERKTFYLKAMEGIEEDRSREKYRTLNNFLIEHRIFMTDELREQFAAVAADISNGLIEYSTGKDHDMVDMRRGGFTKIDALKSKVSAIEQLIQKRLRYEEA